MATKSKTPPTPSVELNDPTNEATERFDVVFDAQPFKEVRFCELNLENIYLAHVYISPVIDIVTGLLPTFNMIAKDTYISASINNDFVHVKCFNELDKQENGAFIPRDGYLEGEKYYKNIFRDKASSIKEDGTSFEKRESLPTGGRDIKARAPYRKAHQLPDPSRPPGAEINRTKQQVKLRLAPDLIADIDQAAAEGGATRNDWMEAALKAALKPRP